MSAASVWITGAGGLIGSYLLRTASACAPPWQPRGLTRGDLDLTDSGVLRRRFAQERPAAVIHCAAISKSLACQSNPDLARSINVEATRILADLANEIPFVFFSTDLVFDGRQGYYDESAAPNPLSVYAETKADAERAVLQNPRHTVIRTSLNGGVSPTGDRGFNEEMRGAWRVGRTLDLFTDEFRSPMAAVVTARVVWELLRLNQPGLYHVAGRERLSRWQIGQCLAGRWADAPARIRAASLREYIGPPRAPDTSLDCAKVQALLPFRLQAFSEWLTANPNEMF